MKALLAQLAELADYEEIRKNRTKENGMIQISGCVNTQKIHLLSGIGSGCGYKLVVFSNEEGIRRVFTVWRRDVFVSCKRFAFLLCGY